MVLPKYRLRANCNFIAGHNSQIFVGKLFARADIMRINEI